MGYAERHSVTLVTNSDGDVTGYTRVVSGRISVVIYDKDDYADGVDFVVTSDDTGQAIWSETDVNSSQKAVKASAASL